MPAIQTPHDSSSGPRQVANVHAGHFDEKISQASDKSVVMVLEATGALGAQPWSVGCKGYVHSLSFYANFTKVCIKL